MSIAKEVAEGYQRNRHTEQLQIRISPHLKEKVQQKCDNEGVPYAYVVRRILEKWVEEPPEEVAA